MDRAVAQYRNSAFTLRQQLEGLLASMTAERAQLAASREMLQLEREAFEHEKERVSQVARAQSLDTDNLAATCISSNCLNAGLLRQQSGGT